MREKFMGIALADYEKEGFDWLALRRCYLRFCKESDPPMKLCQ